MNLAKVWAADWWEYPLLVDSLPGYLYFRLFGWGLVIKDTSLYELTYGERVKGKGIQLGKFRVRGLIPD